jgi:hypothetical protein
LNGIPTKIRALWTDSTIGAIISRKVYTGVIEMNGESYTDENIRIIDDKPYALVQAHRDSSHRFGVKRKGGDG